MAIMSFEFLDVGMGDGTFVMMGNSESTMELALVDFGVHRLTKFKIGKQDAMAYLVETIDRISYKRGMMTPYLDHLFITHPHADHFNAIKDLINAKYPSFDSKLSIGRLTFGGTKGLYPDDLIGYIAKFVTKGGVDDLGSKFCSTVNKVTGVVDPFRTFANKEIRVYLLSANAPILKAKADYNQLSLCLMFVDQSANKVILMGDAGADVEARIIKYFKDEPGFLRAYGLKLGHHGSDTATSEEWLAAVKPKAVFASGDMVWAHPYCNAIERVKKAHTVEETQDTHAYCCGKSLGGGKRDYFNNWTDLQIFLNIWYFVKDEDGEMMQDEEGAVELAQEGSTFGVQWKMEFDRKNITFKYTDTSRPVKSDK